MREKPLLLIADSVRKKSLLWQQIRITSFAKKMQGVATLKAEKCCDTYHQTMRRDGSEYRKHPKRVLRAFIYYTVYNAKLAYEDQEGASILLHDVPEEVGLITLISIKEHYGQLIPIYVKMFTRMKGESKISYFKKIAQTDFLIMSKICDMIDGFIGMLDEFYAKNLSSSKKRIESYLTEKAFPFLEIIQKRNLTGLKYEKSIKEALTDFSLICQEAEEVLRINSNKKIERSQKV